MKQRLFIALDPSEDLRQEIIDLQSRLEKLELPLRFEPAEKLHLTLNFLGAVDKTAVSTIGTMIRSVTAKVDPFILKPAFLETLYQKHDQSLIYLGIAGDTHILRNLHTELKTNLADSRFPQPKRFLARITIGRVIKTDPAMTKSVLDKIRDFDFRPLSDFEVDHISLYESLLSREGSHYRRIGRFMLK